MPTVTGFNNSFASGEIGPDAWERSDLQQHATGCEEALNFLGLVAGPNASRGGMVNRGAPRDQDKACRYFAWNRADGEGLVLEIGNFYGRVWTAGGVQLEMAPGVWAQFAHPYATADLAGLRLSQIGDIGFFTQREGVRWTRIERLSDISWSVDNYPLISGPWLPENSDPDKQFTLNDNLDGTWELTTNFDLLLPAHVGARFRVKAEGGAVGLRSWSPNTVTPGFSYVVSAGRVYQNMSGSITSGNTPPSHDRGEASDGVISWRYAHDGQGYIVIQTVHTLRHATVVIPEQTPLVGSPVSTSNWSEAAYSDVQGWPTALAAVREERLVLAASKAAPDGVRLSRTAGFTPASADFKPGLGTGLVVDDDAVSVTLGGKRARVVWAVDALNLIVGTTEAEWIVSGGSVDDPIAPASVAPRRISGHGSADVMPVVVQGPPVLLLHVARGGKTLHELQLSGQNVAPGGRDLSVLASHIFGLGVRDMCWSQPDNTLWLLLSDGSLAAYTYHFDQQVFGVRRQPMAGGWRAEAIATAPDAEGVDRLHVAAVRTKNGEPQRAHFVLARREDDVWLDAAGIYDGAPTSGLTGLDALEGETVRIVADGGLLADQVVVGGMITLAEPASRVVVGLPMLRRFKSLPFVPDRAGQTVARKGRPVNCYVVLGLVRARVSAEPQDEPTDAAAPYETVESRRPGDLIPVFRRKRSKVNLGGGADRDMRVVVESDDPFDLIIYALRPGQDEQ